MKYIARLKVLLAIFMVVMMNTVAEAVIINYDNLADFNAAVGPHAVITFTEFPVGTILTTQYAPEGVIFGDGNDVIISDSNFTVDGVGVDANGTIEVLFSTAQTFIGSEFPGALQFAIYDGATLLGISDQFAQAGTGFFGGIVSTEPFTRVIISDWFEPHAFIDSLHYGSAAVPEPTTLLLLGSGLVGLAALRRKFSE